MFQCDVKNLAALTVILDEVDIENMLWISSASSDCSDVLVVLSVLLALVFLCLPWAVLEVVACRWDNFLLCCDSWGFRVPVFRLICCQCLPVLCWCTDGRWLKLWFLSWSVSESALLSNFLWWCHPLSFFFCLCVCLNHTQQTAWRGLMVDPLSHSI